MSSLRRVAIRSQLLGPTGLGIVDCAERDPQLSGSSFPPSRRMSSGRKQGPSQSDAAGGPSRGKTISPDEAPFAPLSLPPLGTDPRQSLPSLLDDSSSYAAVAKTCLQLTQFAGDTSSACAQDVTTVASAHLRHDASTREMLRSAFEALLHCLQHHTDRRCRMLACKTLALLARSAYTCLRPSPLLWSVRDARLHELEDDVGSEVPAALVAVVLDEPDDGLSAAAIEAIGVLLRANATLPIRGSLVDDELQTHRTDITMARASPYAPSLRNLLDEDPAIPHMELATRILDNIMVPRLIPLLERIDHYQSLAYKTLALPTLTTCLVHYARTTPTLASTMDRATYAKRWIEVDASGLVDAVVQTLVWPGLAGPGAATHWDAALRLASVQSHRPWVPRLCNAVVQGLRQELDVGVASRPVEQRLAYLATLLVAARAMPVLERCQYLVWATALVAQLPSTAEAPYGVTSPGALVNLQGYRSYRRPARTGLLVEVALSLLLDGPVERPGAREDALQSYLSSPTVVNILRERDRTAVIPLYDELLLVFCYVAVEAGMRFRARPDGTPLRVDAHAGPVKEWLALARIVLTHFIGCVTATQNVLYLEENLSLATAGESNYVRLVQLYLHTAGLVHADTSIAFKLAANACPPHLLWDVVAESATFDAKFGATATDDEVERALALMDEFVARETRHNLASHHMRMFLLTLAADAWVEARVLSIQNHGGNGPPPSLNVNSARAIATALGPKRLIAKIYEGHTPPVDSEGKKKRDPVKTLAKDAVRAAVAAIENIALVACSWRRRFGSSQEAKLVVSVTVGLLNGKVDETPMDENMKAIMGPLCDAAVVRIQAEYQDESTVAPTDPFPMSDLVTQPVKPKIKPLVSNAKPVSLDTEKILRNYLMQLTRQLVAARTELCLLSSAYVDSALSSARPSIWLRLAVPPQQESKDGRTLGSFCAPLAAWGMNVAECSSASDPLSIIAAYTPRRYLRHDGEDEYRVTLLMKVNNNVPVSLPDGVKLEISFCRYPDNGMPSNGEARFIVDYLGGDEAIEEATPLFSSSSVFRQELKPGEQIVFEISLDPRSVLSCGHAIPSVVYRNLPIEPDESGAKWTGESLAAHGDASTTTGGESKSGEDDFQVKPKVDEYDDSTLTYNAILQGEPLELSSAICLQPCPLVFFRDCWGDLSSFRLLWFSLPLRVPDLKVAKSKEAIACSVADQKLARISSLRWEGEAIPGGFATALWAFMALNGSRILACLVELDDGENDPKLRLHVRGDDKHLLLTLLALKETRKKFVATLCPGLSTEE